MTKLKVTPEDNDTSQSLKAGGEKNVADAQDAQGRGVRQGLRRPRSRVSPGGARRRRQDADPEREERRAEGAAREGAAGVRRAPRARQARAGVALEVAWRRARVSRALDPCSLRSSPSPSSRRRARRRRSRQRTPSPSTARASRPADLTVNAGDTIVWVNKDPFPHTATSKTGGFDSDGSGRASRGRSCEEEGEFPYICTSTPDEGHADGEVGGSVQPQRRPSDRRARRGSPARRTTQRHHRQHQRHAA